MFRCDCCGLVTQPGERAYKIAVEERSQTYECVVEREVKLKGKPKTITRRFTTEGREIVREITVCPECASIHRGVQEAARGELVELDLTTLEE